ncbi:uncharacterized protein B0I36DRAFT_72188 [Microdochium trichocladiopsis]|uniref:Serine/threonine-protein kinase ppk6 n=1 Tax=Microdochium trichocladiopsis TaxID=1682393 RepID=A0A9P8YFA9_9PEZI|nr:uncharacterized protein B0I36DRAFT_72188 [Microdochium trichocladiopsis]KAH7037867.1 hypothetical protein B0I36DRAFT_72188 [Microdochium trichocladiopsis]
MSADLFAEFESGDSQPPQQPSQGVFNRPAGFGHSAQRFSVPSYAQPGHGQQPHQQPSPAPGPFSAQGWNFQSQAAANNPWPAIDPKQNTKNSSQLGNDATQDEDDDDAWGDFEVAAPQTQPAQPSPALQASGGQLPGVAPSNQAAFAGLDSWDGPSKQEAVPPPRTRIVRASTMDLLTNNLLSTGTVTPAPEKQKKSAFKQDDFFGWDEVAPSNTTKPAVVPKPSAQPKLSAKPLPRDSSSNVLFDADDYGEGIDLGDEDDDDDDFGDFESGATTLEKPAQDLLSLDFAAVPTAKAPGVMSLANLNINDSSLSRFPAPKSPSYQERNPFPGLSVTTPPSDLSRKLEPSSNATPTTAWPSAGAGNKSPIPEDNWGAFEDFPDEPKKAVQTEKPTPKPSMTKAKKVTRAKPAKEESDWDWGFDEEEKAPVPSKSGGSGPSTKLDSSWDWDSAEPQPSKTTSHVKDDVPPINIPPPSVLISIFPQLLGQANTFLFKPTAKQAQSVKDRILADPKTLEFLRGYLTLARVAARVIAGRKSRWHRDKFLAQSMSISAAGSKGMKLAGVDKAQAARESREAGDVVDLWKENVGRLRSAVAAVNPTIPDAASQLRVPELSESMHVTTAKDVPAAVKACIICGLKREERVSKVDFTVEDSFGEWWSDHWGHVECKRFWLEHETALRQR